jgi:feruloyl esterase
VIAGAPVYDFRTQTSGWVRAMNFAPADRRLSQAHPERMSQAVVSACDGADGAEEGVIRDPRACAWDPGELACAAGESGDTCLTPGQVDAVRVAYEGVALSDGSIAAFPLSRGTEDQWARYAQDPDQTPGNESWLGGLSVPLFGRELARAEFDPERDVPVVRNGEFASLYEADDPEIGDFIARGGKLLLWHGFYDQGPSPVATVEYYERVVAEADAPTADAVRLFLAPGVAHCRGGPGPDQFDLLGTLETWVEEGRAPDEMAATKVSSDIAWPVCAYPKLPRGSRTEDGQTTYACE